MRLKPEGLYVPNLCTVKTFNMSVLGQSLLINCPAQGVSLFGFGLLEFFKFDFYEAKRLLVPIDYIVINSG